MSLTDADRRLIAAWAADCAERSLPIFEDRAPADGRPGAAIAGAHAYGRGTARVSEMRPHLRAAYAAGREVGDPAPAAAARAAGLAAATAFIHFDETTLGTLGHIVGPAAYAALARERATPDERDLVEREIGWAIASVPPEVRAIVRRLPAPEPRGRLGRLMARIDAGIRG
ncbi:MAG TPA: hypothetical protein VJ506_12250 [Candidatus Limnocylindrales bacterium]|nr:hypothetical protein [Candidatus Limnocylindrales bacterium]